MEESRKGFLPWLITTFKTGQLAVLLLTHCILLILAWHSASSVFVVFLAFVPLFYVFSRATLSYNEKLGLYILSFLAVFFYTYFTLYWIRTANARSHFIISFLSAAVLYLPYLLSFLFRFKAKAGAGWSIFLFISLSLLIEVLHDLNILGFPYLNLGHLLGASPKIIQWYAYSGSIGGTIWIFALNLALYLLIQIIFDKKKKFQKVLGRGILLTGIFLLPIVISLKLYSGESQAVKTDLTVVALHPSIDVYSYKYAVDPDTLLSEYIKLTLSYIDNQGNYIVFWPENALTGNVFLPDLDQSKALRVIREELCSRPGIALITGAVVEEAVDAPAKNAYVPNIMFNADSAYYYKRYNAALYITADMPTLIKYKERLIPFSERFPTSKIFKPLISKISNLAELNFSEGDPDIAAFNIHGDCSTSPVICYGSAFSSFVAGEIARAGSDFLAVISNEGWMKQEKAYRHFYWFAVCRAIENRRFLLKSSNEGISAIIDEKGRGLVSEMRLEPSALSYELQLNTRKTFFTRYYKLIYLLMASAVPLMLVVYLLRKNSGKTRHL